jgi:glycosyltransferase involved in cell wall biosynthesis
MSKIKILNISSRYADNCGVGKYQEAFVNEFNHNGEVEADFFEVSLFETRLMTKNGIKEIADKLTDKLKDYDILHIQHEFGLYSNNEFAEFVRVGKSLNKKVVVTLHLAPAFAFRPNLKDYPFPLSIIQRLRRKRLYTVFKSNHIKPLFQTDLIITHNNKTTSNIISLGVNASNILQIHHPVLKSNSVKNTTNEITKMLNKKKGDVIYSAVGFMHKYKGIDEAVKALSFLPENYKLAIIGGMHPTATVEDAKVCNKITDLIIKLKLKDRVYITGAIADSDRLNALIRETDICIYPYNNDYYGWLSSGSLNLAFANDRPVITYPVDTFNEINDEFHQLIITSSPTYYELARELRQVDTKKQLDNIKKYAAKYNWAKMAKLVEDAYKKLYDNGDRQC